jgi:hypothetical protein
MRAEHARGRQRADAIEGRDERGQVFVLAQVAQALGQEEVAGEEPAALALEEADVVGAVPGGRHHLEAQRARHHRLAQGLRLDPRGPSPGQPAIALLHESRGQQRQRGGMGLHGDAARGAQDGGGSHVVLVMVGHHQRVDRTRGQRAHERARRGRRSAVHEKAVDEVCARPVQRPARQPARHAVRT